VVLFTIREKNIRGEEKQGKISQKNFTKMTDFREILNNSRPERFIIVRIL
jgi:hypothetical protein